MALRFDETGRFLCAACDPPPSSEQIARAHKGTEGWPAALRLAALGHAGITLPEPGSPGGQRTFAVLMQDLLESLQPATVRFMAETAVLEQLNAELCDAVTQRSDAAQEMEGLVQRHLLVEPLDSDGGWLRLHQPLRDYLRHTVAQRLDLDQTALHLRAAHWFADRSAWTDAVRHAHQSGASAQAVGWLAHCGMALVTAAT